MDNQSAGALGPVQARSPIVNGDALIPPPLQQRAWATEWAISSAEASVLLQGKQSLPLFSMGAKEAAAYVKKLDRALRSYASDFDLGIDKDNALAAFESVITLLLEFREHYPAERPNIDEVLRRHGYSIVEN